MLIGTNTKERGKENYLKRKIRKLEAVNLRVRCINAIMFVATCIMFVLFIRNNAKVVMQSSMINDLQKDVASSSEIYETTVEEKDNRIFSLVQRNNEMADHMKKLAYATIDINSELNELKREYNTNMKRLQELEEREELYDKYDYALFCDGVRTDVTYQRIKDVEEYAKDKGLSEDAVALIMSLVSTESHGIASAENDSSSAAGLGQLLYGTAKFVYEEEMNNGKGSYTYDLALNPDINLKMTTSYISYLANYYNNNAVNVLTAYRGDDSPGYENVIEKKLNSSDLSLYTLSLIQHE